MARRAGYKSVDVSPDLHAELAQRAAAAGLSVTRLVERELRGQRPVEQRISALEQRVESHEALLRRRRLERTG